VFLFQGSRKTGAAVITHMQSERHPFSQSSSKLRQSLINTEGRNKTEPIRIEPIREAVELNPLFNKPDLII
jgi:hypothetical protein